MKKLSDVIPIPLGNKMFITSKKREKKSRIIIVDEVLELLDVQEVVVPGEYQRNIISGLKIEAGDWVRVNWDSPSFIRKYSKDKPVARTDGSGVVDTERSNVEEFAVPLYNFAGEDYILVDKSDITWIWKKQDLIEE